MEDFEGVGGLWWILRDWESLEDFEGIGSLLRGWGVCGGFGGDWKSLEDFGVWRDRKSLEDFEGVGGLWWILRGLRIFGGF